MKKSLVIVFLICIVFVGQSFAETIDTRIGKLSFTHDFANGYPTQATIAKLFNEMDFQRATQVYLWALPIVSFAQWQYSHEEIFDAQNGDIVFYLDYVSKLGILTANATTPYAVSFINLAETGPIVIEMPKAEVRGGVSDMWQIAIRAMIKPGKYLYYAPGTRAPKVPPGYIVSEATTNNIFFALRLMSKDEKSQMRVLNMIKIYPFANRNNQAKTRVVKAGNQKWGTWHPRGLGYFERLANILNSEVVDERDRFFHAMLKPLGIEKGRAFNPTENQVAILTEAALVGEAMAKANDFDKSRLEASLYVEGSQWEVATVSPPNQRWENYEALDGRAAWFYEALTNSPSMQTTTPGKGQIYLGSYRDSNGDWFDGAQNYELLLPPNAPAEAFWSVTIYDVSTRCLINNKQKIADSSSRYDLIKNKDGSINIYIGPTPPKGMQANWIPTVPGRAWFTYFRFYSPTEAYFDRSWVLPDIEKANGN
jgi:hypothetical protein